MGVLNGMRGRAARHEPAPPCDKSAALKSSGRWQKSCGDPLREMLPAARRSPTGLPDSEGVRGVLQRQDGTLLRVVAKSRHPQGDEEIFMAAFQPRQNHRPNAGTKRRTE